MTLAERIRERDLTAGERRVADLILGDPSRLAFGSVAAVAADAGVGNSTVMRFASKLGFGGFSELQTAARDEMDGRLRQATHRIRQHPTGDPVARARDIELANLQETFAQLDTTVTAAAADALARAGTVAVVAGDAARGVALDFTIQLGMVRGGVEVADVGSIALSRSLAWLGRDDVLVAIDTARYERTVATAVGRAAADGARVLAVSDSHVSPIARVATWSFPVVDTGAGPFDSFVAALALTNLLVSLTARRLGRKAVRHIDRLDADWNATGVLRTD
jgi:DNA-binding MurR/RpiR family transcriptional regulator